MLCILNRALPVAILSTPEKALKTVFKKMYTWPLGCGLSCSCSASRAAVCFSIIDVSDLWLVRH